MEASRRQPRSKDPLRSNARNTEAKLEGVLFKNQVSLTAAATPPSGRKKTNYGLQRDYRVLAQQKKVSAILGNLEFRSKLESIVHDQASGKKPARASQPPAPPGEATYGKPHPPKPHLHHPLAVSGGLGVVVPIDDLDIAMYSPAEAQQRCKLAAVYRLADILGWSRLTNSFITALTPSNNGCFFIKPHNLLYYEVTASSLVELSFLHGNGMDEESSEMGVNESGVWLHSVVYRSRPNVRCILHLQHPAVMAVSSLTSGFLTMSSHAVLVGKVSYCEASWFGHDANEDELAVILSKNKVVVLQGCGMLALGSSVEDAFSTANMLVNACQVQVMALSAGLSEVSTDIRASGWGTGEGCGSAGMEFEALMRMLDRMGYQTGYKYCLAVEGTERGRKQEEETRMTGRKRVDQHVVSGRPECEEDQDNKDHQGKCPQWRIQPQLMEAEDLQKSRLDLVTDTAQRVARSTEEALARVSAADSKGLNLSDEVTATAQRVAKSTEQALERVTRAERTGLDLSDAVTSTAKKVAESTGEMLGRMTRQVESQSLNSSNQVLATAKRVAQSTGEVLEKVMHKDERAGQDMLGKVEETAQQVAKSTGDALKQVSQENQPEGTSMLQHTEVTAKRVARSTGHVVQRLATGGKFAEEGRNCTRRERLHGGTLQPVTPSGARFGMHDDYLGDVSSVPSPSLPSHSSLDNEVTQDPSHKARRKLPSLPPAAKCVSINVPSSSIPLHNGYKEHDPPVFHHLNGVKRTRRSRRTPDSASISSEYSTTESPPGHRSKSLVAHRQSVINDPDLNESALQRMTETAELVAASTGQAVITLTHSLLS